MDIATLLVIVGGVAMIGKIVTQVRFTDTRWVVWSLLMDATFAIADIIWGVQYLFHDPPWSAFSFTFAAYWIWQFWDDWRNWKDKKKIREALGAKSRALRDNLVKRMREGASPSPVRIPV